MKKTLVLGASPNPDRYSNIASLRLNAAGYEVFPVGNQEGEIAGIKILTNMPHIEGVDTLSLYVGPAKQPIYEDYIFNIMPKRIIFNPGTENTHLMEEAANRGIEVVVACTLVMLSLGDY